VVAAAVERAGMPSLPGSAAEQFSVYFDLLQRWNNRLNLTAIRDPSEILKRHFLECIFCAQNLPNGINSLLDYGSGAGFPGIPIALCRPEIQLTLAESQGKKASFLREAVRTLGIDTEVYLGRVEDLPPERVFDAVALRAVDQMKEAIREAVLRVRDSGWLMVLASRDSVEIPAGFMVLEKPVPKSEKGVLFLGRKSDVPRETLLKNSLYRPNRST
jgi:16S rRNA (guanine527-N7)-methyltransferase